MVVTSICQTLPIECELDVTSLANLPDNHPAPPPGGAGESSLKVRALFDQEESPLLRYAYSLVGRRAVAEEIVQDVFLQLHTLWDEVESPRAWLFRSVRNRSFKHNRDNKREVLTDEHDEAPTEAAKSETPEDVMLRKEAVGNLRLFVEELDEDDRQLVKLKYFDGLKYRDISERTGLSVGNVGYRLHHLLKGLAERMRQLGIDGLS